MREDRRGEDPSESAHDAETEPEDNNGSHLDFALIAHFTKMQLPGMTEPKLIGDITEEDHARAAKVRAEQEAAFAEAAKQRASKPKSAKSIAADEEMARLIREDNEKRTKIMAALKASRIKG